MIVTPRGILDYWRILDERIGMVEVGFCHDTGELADLTLVFYNQQINRNKMKLPNIGKLDNTRERPVFKTRSTDDYTVTYRRTPQVMLSKDSLYVAFSNDSHKEAIQMDERVPLIFSKLGHFIGFAVNKLTTNDKKKLSEHTKHS